MNPETWILVFTIVSFLVVLFVLGKFGWPKIVQTLEEREKSIRNAIDSAEAAKQSAEKLKAEYEAQMQAVQERVREIIAQAQVQGTQTRESILKEAESEAKKLMEKTKQQLEAEKEKLVQELRGEVGELAVMMAEKLLQQTVDKKVQERFVQDFLKNLDVPPGKMH